MLIMLNVKYVNNVNVNKYMKLETTFKRQYRSMNRLVRQSAKCQ